MGNKEDIGQVNTASLRAIDALFTEYNQDVVVVAEGYLHCICIAAELLRKGYVKKELTIQSLDITDDKDSDALC